MALCDLEDVPPVRPFPCLRRPHLKANEGQAALGFHILGRRDRTRVIQGLDCVLCLMRQLCLLVSSAEDPCFHCNYQEMAELGLEGRLVSICFLPCPNQLLVFTII